MLKTLVIWLAVVFVAAALNEDQLVDEVGKLTPDLVLSGNELEGSYSLKSFGRARRAVRIDRKWPLGQIPYTIAGSYSVSELNTIAKSIQIYSNLTCIRFVPRTNQNDYISIESNSTECKSRVGRTGGKQILTLGKLGKSSCVDDHNTLHEMMHTIGFNHEVTRADRDNFVNIITANILPAKLDYFTKLPPTDNFGVAYDFTSVMHAPLDRHANAKGLQTIVPKVPQSVTIGRSARLSEGDIRRIRAMYNCQ